MSALLDFKTNKRLNDEKLRRFSFELQGMATRVGFKVPSRGWCYLLEQARMIDKSGFKSGSGRAFFTFLIGHLVYGAAVGALCGYGRPEACRFA